MVVYKYELVFNGSIFCSVDMPKDAKILRIDEQRDGVFAWALVNPLAKPEAREIGIFGTGRDIPELNMVYINTFLSTGGTFVWHAFERAPASQPVKQYDVELYPIQGNDCPKCHRVIAKGGCINDNNCPMRGLY